MLDISGVKQRQKIRKVYSKKGHQGKAKGHSAESTRTKAVLKTVKSESIARSSKRALSLIYRAMANPGEEQRPCLVDCISSHSGP